jgi:hypothetical protein
MADIGTLALAITADSTQFEAAFQRSLNQAQNFATSVTSFIPQITASVQALTAAVEANPIGALIAAGQFVISVVEGMTGSLRDVVNELGQMIDAGDRAAMVQANLSRRFGLTAEAAGGLALEARALGIDADTLRGSLQAFSQRLGEAALNGGAAEKGLERLGLRAQDLIQMPVDQAMAAIGDALNTVGNAGERNALRFEILGRRAAELEPILSRGSAGMAHFSEESQRWGLTFSEASARSLRETVNAQREAQAAMDSVQQSIANALAEAAAPIQKFIAQLKTAFVEMLQSGAVKEIRAAISSLGELGNSLKGVLGPVLLVTMQGIGQAIQFIAFTIRLAAEALSLVANPAGTIGRWFGSRQNVTATTLHDSNAVAPERRQFDPAQLEAFGQQLDRIQRLSDDAAKAVATFGMSANDKAIHEATQAYDELVNAIVRADQAATQSRWAANLDTEGLAVSRALAEAGRSAADTQQIISAYEQMASGLTAEQTASLSLAAQAQATTASSTQEIIANLQEYADAMRAANVELSDEAMLEILLAQAAYNNARAHQQELEKLEEGMEIWKRAQKVMEDNLSPLQKYYQQLEELDDLYALGAIGAEDYAAASLRALEQLERANGQQRNQLAQGLQAGSAGAVSLVNQISAGARTDPVDRVRQAVEAQTQVQNQQLEYLRRFVNASLAGQIGGQVATLPAR